MKSIFATKKTILLAILLALLVCCLTITLALGYQQQVATAAESVASVDELPSEERDSDEYDIMPIATVTAGNQTTLQNLLNNTASNNVIELTANITLTTGIKFSVNRTITLDLKGHYIKGVSSSFVLTVSNGYLKLQDSTGGGKITGGNGGVNITGGTLEMNSGEISGNIQSGHSGGVEVGSSGTFRFNGGTIKDNTALTGNGGGVRSKGYFKMMGGTISGNTANAGGGVYSSGTFDLLSGTITGNTALTAGGGVYSSGGNLQVRGASNPVISANKAPEGAGVYCSSDTFTLESGTIKDNIATGLGGGVYMKSGAATWSSVTITGNKAENGAGVYFVGGTMGVSGTVKVFGNTKNGVNNNLYIAGTNKINVVSAPTGGANTIGISAENNGIFTTGTVSSLGAFFSDVNTKCLAIKNNSISIGTHTYDAWQYTETQHWHECTHCGLADTKTSHNNDEHITERVEPKCAKTTSSTVGLKAYSQCTDCGIYFTETGKIIGDRAAFLVWEKTEGDEGGMLPVTHDWDEANEFCQVCGKPSDTKQADLDGRVQAAQQKLNERLEYYEGKESLTADEQKDFDKLKEADLELKGAYTNFQQAEGYDNVMDALERLEDAIAAANNITDKALNNKKQAALAEIDAAVARAKAMVDERVNGSSITKAQGEQIKTLIEKEAERAKNDVIRAADETAVDKIVDKVAGVKGDEDERKNGSLEKLAQTEIEKIELANAKEQAKERLEEAAAKANEAIDDSNLNYAAKKAKKEEVADLLKAGLQVIDDAEDIDSVTRERESYIEQIYNAVKDLSDESGESVLDPSLEKEKDAAKDAIDQKAKEAKNAVDNRTDGLSDDDKETLKELIDKEASRAKNDIDNANSSEEVLEAQKKGEENIDKIANTEVGNMDLAKAKDAAKDKVDRASKDAKYVVDERVAKGELTNEESKKLKALIDQEADKAKSRIDDATNEAEIDSIVDEVVGTEDTQGTLNKIANTQDTELERKKSEARSAIEDAARKAKEAIDSLDDLTPEQKGALQAEIQAKADAAKAKVDEATSISAVDSILAEVLKEIQEIRDLAEVKSSANKAIDDAAQAAKDAIDEMDGLTKAQKKAFKDQIKARAEQAKESVDQAKTIEEIYGDESNDQDNGLMGVYEDDLAAILALARAKSNANKAIDDAAQRAKDEVDRRVEEGELTPEQGEDLKDIIDKEADRAKDEVDKATDPDEIDDILDRFVGEDNNGIFDDLAKTEPEDVELKKAKERAKERLEEAAARAREAIDNSNLENKDSVKAEVDKWLEKAIKAIEAQNSVEDVNTTLEEELSNLYDYLEGLNEEHPEIGDDPIIDRSLEEAKDAAKGEIDKAADAAKKRVNDRDDLTDEEKQDLKDVIDREAERAKAEIDKAKSVPEVDEILDRVLGELPTGEEGGNRSGGIIDKLPETPKEDVELEKKKSEAKDEIDDAAQRAKDKVDERVKNGEITEEEGDRLKDIIDKEANRAKDDIDQAQTVPEVDEILDRVLGTDKDEDGNRTGGSLDQVAGSNDADLEEEKSATKDEIQKEADKAKEAVDGMDGLTDEQKKALKDEIQKKANEAKAEIDKAVDEDDLAVKKEKGLKDIQDIVDLAKSKSEANKAIDEAAEEAKKAIDGMDGLTDEQKKSMKNAIDEAAKKAKDAIDKADTVEGVEGNDGKGGALGDGLREIGDIEDLAKAKSEANKAIDDARDAAKKEVDDRVANGELTPEEGEDLKDIIDQEADRAKGDVDNAKDPGEVGDILDRVVGGEEGGGTLGELAKTPKEDIGLEKKKSDAKDVLDKAAKEAKDAIDKRTDLTDEGKETLKDVIDQEVTRTREDIDKAETAEEIDEAVEKGKANIDRIAKSTDPELEQKKQEAKDDVNKKAEEEKKQVEQDLADGKITDDEADRRLKEIEEERKKALDEIDKAESLEELEQALAKAKDALHSAANPNKPKIDLEVGLPIIILAIQALIVGIVLIVVKSKK